MFTGIIEKTEKILNLSKDSIIIKNPFKDNDYQIGDSISLNGVCLTLKDIKKDLFYFDISKETFERTNFKYLKKNEIINIERALKPNSHLGGHFVTGHIDDTAKLSFIKREKDFYEFKFYLSNTKYLIEKGSVSINGISLTCYEIKSNSFKISVISHTYQNTNLKFLKINSYVNIEFDILSKTLLKDKEKINFNFLKENGFF